MRKEAEAWLKISAEDLQSAEVLSDRKLFRPACYHAQQSVEKSLKALLIDRNIDFPRTHNLLDLNNAVKKLGYAVALTPRPQSLLWRDCCGMSHYQFPTYRDTGGAPQTRTRFF